MSNKHVHVSKFAMNFPQSSSVITILSIILFLICVVKLSNWNEKLLQFCEHFNVRTIEYEIANRIFRIVNQSDSLFIS